MCAAVQNPLSSHLLSKNVKIEIHKIIILLAALYRCDSLSLTLNKECRLGMFKNRVLRKMLERKRFEVAGDS
jgi:hypothetical protein